MNVYVPSTVGVALTGPYEVLSPLTVTGDPVTVSPEGVHPGPSTLNVICPSAFACVAAAALIVPPGPIPSVPGCFAVPVSDAWSMIGLVRVTSSPAVVVSTGVTGPMLKHSDVVPPSMTAFDGSFDAGTPTVESPEYSARQQ